MFISEVNKFTPVSAPVQVLSTPVNYLSTPPQDLSELVDPLYALPGQTNLLDQIAEVESQLPNNQVVQEEVETEPVLHQSEEVVEDVIEDIEVPFDIDEDDDAMLGSILSPIEKLDTHKDVYEVFEETPLVSSKMEIVDYTDPAGNTFEAPIVIDDFAEEDNFDLDFTETEEETGDVPDFF